MDRNYRSRYDGAGVHRVGDAVNGDPDLAPGVQQLPQSDRTAATIFRHLAFVDVDRPARGNVVKRRLEDARAVHDAEVGLLPADEIQRLDRVRIVRGEK